MSVLGVFSSLFCTSTPERITSLQEKYLILFIVLLRGVLNQSKSSFVEETVDKTEVLISFNSYLADPCEPFSTVFQFWNKSKYSWPIANAVKRFLIALVPSVSSEGAFSTAGYTISDRQNRLSSEVVSELMFVNKNYHLL